MARINGEQIAIIPYDTSEVDFISPVKKALGLSEDDELDLIHEHFFVGSVVTRENDSITEIHRRYYEDVAKTDFYDQYRYFANKVVANLIDGPFVIQKVPSFRVHLPGNKAVGTHHRDSDFGHQAGAINFWLPLTNAYDTNTIYIAKDEQSNPTPVNVDHGQVLVFDAVNLLHGNEINKTGRTRVSFDFRVISESDYVDSDNKSINTMTKLAIGGYYTKLADL